MIDPISFIASLWLGAGAPGPKSWAVCYGATASVEALQAPDVLVLEPDHPWYPAEFRRKGQKVLAYLSLGEVHESRSYYRELVRSPGVTAGRNPNWPGAVAVDPRSKTWRSMVLDRLAPELLDRGYDGFFLDTVDIGPTLEAHGYPGASRAMASLVRALKERFPGSMLVSNGGLGLLDETAGSLGAVAVESVFTDYRFATRRYQWRPLADAALRKERLREVTSRYGLPVLALEYGDESMRPRATTVIRDAGLVPFVSDISLSSLPDPS